jgi:hypothetical protein
MGAGEISSVSHDCFPLGWMIRKLYANFRYELPKQRHLQSAFIIGHCDCD